MLCPRTQHNNKLTQLGLQALSPDLDSSTHTKRPLCLRQTRVIIAKYYTWMNPQNSINLMHHSFPNLYFQSSSLKWNSLLFFLPLFMSHKCQQEWSQGFHICFFKNCPLAKDGFFDCWGSLEQQIIILALLCTNKKNNPFKVKNLIS